MAASWPKLSLQLCGARTTRKTDFVLRQRMCKDCGIAQLVNVRTVLKPLNVVDDRFVQLMELLPAIHHHPKPTKTRYGVSWFYFKPDLDDMLVKMATIAGPPKGST